MQNKQQRLLSIGLLCFIFKIKDYWENRSVVNHQWQIDTILVEDTFKFHVR